MSETYAEASPARIDGLIQALEDQRYQWRTVDGLVQDLRLSREEIERMLAEMKTVVIRSSIPDERGRSLSRLVAITPKPMVSGTGCLPRSQIES